MTVRLSWIAAAMAAAATLSGQQPLAVIDLAADEGVRLVKGQWKYQDARIVETEFQGRQTRDIAPHAGGADFDDAAWEKIAAGALGEKRGAGRLSFGWYRIQLTVPERVDGVETKGTDLVLETSVDDAAEVWVDGELPRALGQTGGSMVYGWNAVNRLRIGHEVKPGAKIQLAIFGINGPLSNPPTNYIFMRTAKVKVYPAQPGPYAVPPQEVNVEVIRKDPAMDGIVGPNPKIHKLAEGFLFTEGPVWDRAERRLLFSDPNANTIYQYSEERGLAVFRKPSGYAGADIAEYGQPGSNGLTFDPRGRLTINEHGNRRVIRIEKDGLTTVLSSEFGGKRLNSPNDLVYRSDGTLYFTDPPFGLPKFFEDPRKELPFSGVYRWRNGELKLVSRDFTGPNGIVLSPDERFLYVANWDEKNKAIRRYEVMADGTLRDGTLFFDMTGAQGEDALDGMKVDERGNLYVSGPGGLWVLSPEGKHLGTIVPPRHPHNFAWGDEDGKTLYLCARGALYKMRLNIAGGNRP